MINVAIVGLGRWGRNLVNSTSGSTMLRFTTANSRTRQSADAYCREKSLRWAADLDQILNDPAIDAVVFATRTASTRIRCAAPPLPGSTYSWKSPSL